MFEFNKISIEDEKAVVAKFKEYGKGVVMDKFVGHGMEDELSAKWTDLIDQTKYSEKSIKNKMLEIARHINSTCNDEFLGDMTIAYSFTDEKDNVVKFTFVDMYTFLRAALRYRRETSEYKKKKARIAELNQFIENNKSVDEKIRDAQAELKELEGTLDV